MNNISMECYIVGMRHYNVPFNIYDAIKEHDVQLCPEPNNPHDSNAVAVYLRGEKIGHINRDAAKKISATIKLGGSYSLSVKPHNSGVQSIPVSILIINENTVTAPRIASSPRTSGIYQISIIENESGIIHVYIGQSVDLNARLQSHWRDLSYGEHANKHMQRLWALNGDQCFSAKILELAPTGFLNELQRQRWLAAREQHHIIEAKNSANECINISAAEIVPTAKANSLYLKELESYDSKIRAIRKEIFTEIKILEEKKTDLDNEMHNIRTQIDNKAQFLSKNTGLTAVFKKVDKTEVTSARIFINDNRLKLIKLEISRANIRKTILNLEEFRKKYKSIKQIENQMKNAAFRYGLYTGRFPKIDLKKISGGEMQVSDWKVEFSKYCLKKEE